MVTSTAARQRPASGLGSRGSEADAEQALGGASDAQYTVDQALDRCGTWDPFQWLILVYCGLSWMCDAMEVMILSYLGPSAKCEWNLSSIEESGLNSVVFAGMCVGAPVWGMVSDTWGRKVSFFLATLISAVFGFATALAPNLHAMMAFRALVGFGIPAATVAFNLLLEFTPTRQRGLFAVAIEGFWTLGTLIQACLAYALLNSHGWRVLVAVSTTPYVVLLLLLPLVPESPRFLLVKGRADAAQRVLGRVMKVCRRQLPDGRLAPLLAGAEAERAEAELVEAGAATTSRAGRIAGKVWRGVLTVWRALRQLFSEQLWAVTLVLMFMWVVAAFVYYGLVQLVPQLEFVAGEKKECHGGHLNIPRGDLIGNLITSAAEVPGLIFSLLLIHYVSRKLAFAIPMGAIVVPLIPLMAGANTTGATIGCMFLARFFIYSAFNALWALCPEMYPTTVRNFGLGLNNSFSRIGGLLSSFAAVQARASAWHRAPEAIFAALSVVAAALVFLLPRDKKGRSLDDTLDDVKDVAPLQRGVSSLTARARSGSASSPASPRDGRPAAGGGAFGGGHHHHQHHHQAMGKAVDDAPAGAAPDQMGLLQHKGGEL